MILQEEKRIKKPLRTPKGDDNIGGVGDTSIPSNNTFDWKRVSGWCQKFLGLPDSELDSLWYERLADISCSPRFGDISPDIIISLYQLALSKERPS